MTTPIVTQYQLYCLVDGSVTGYSETVPTACFINTAHQINPNSIIALKVISSPVVTTTDSSPVNSQYQITTIPMTIPGTLILPNTTTISQTFPFDMYLWELSFFQNPLSLGDLLNVCVGPNTPIGYTSATCSSGTNTIYTTSTVINSILKGSEISIATAGTSGPTGPLEYPGLVTLINSTGSSFTVQNNLIHSYQTNSIISLSTYPIRNYVFDGGNDRMIVGRKGLTARLVPANTPITVTYVDQTSTTSSNIQIYLQLAYYFK